MKIISRSQWGAKAWRGTPYSTPLSSRTHFLCHYHGGPPPQSSGSWVPKNVEAIHLGNGWSGVGYNFLVAQDGAIYEGRGWNLVGAHCPGMNTKGFGVYVAIGGNQDPSDAALRSVRALYDEANRKTGRTLTKSWHGNHYATACPGPKLIAWVKKGMPASGVPAITGGGSSGGGGGGSTKYYQPTGTKLSVKQIQRIVGVTADGAYGPATKKAVAAYQKKIGVTADQLWGPATDKAHLAYIGRTSTPKPKPSTPKAPKFPLPKGHWYGVESSNPKNHSGYYAKDRAGIKQWQQQMKKRGWKIGVDGRFGPESRKVALAFQKEKRLAADGLVGVSTWRQSWSAPVT